MNTIKELNKSKVPIVKLDESLDNLNDVVLFPEKVEKAKKTIADIGLPKNSRFQKHDRKQE
jgi:hypothetical protein